MSFSYKSLKIDELTIKIGAEKPFSVLHVTDSHLARFDPEKPCKRFEDIRDDIDRYFAEGCEFRRERNMIMLHTGNVVDFVSEANFDYMK